MKQQITIKYWTHTKEYKQELNRIRKELTEKGYKEITDRAPNHSDTITIYANRWGGEWSGKIKFQLERYYKPRNTNQQ